MSKKSSAKCPAPKKSKTSHPATCGVSEEPRSATSGCTSDEYAKSADTVFRVAPTEPAELRSIGVVNLVPEHYGVDVLWLVEGGLAGVQRKAFQDLVASLRDGRLQKELMQMQALKVRVLVIEGTPQWTVDGDWVCQWGRMNRMDLEMLKLSMQDQFGVGVLHSETVAGTVELVKRVAAWSRKYDHDSLRTRPKSVGNAWLTKASNDRKNWLLQGFPGTGYKSANAILKHFKRIPLQWTVTKEELMKVDGIGSGKAKQLIEFLEESE